MSILVTLGQSIEACEKGNQTKLNEIWDMFINTAGWLTDGGLITEVACETVVYSSSFPDNHSLTLDLLKIRGNSISIQQFIDSNKRTLEIKWSPKGLGSLDSLRPEYFADELTSIAVSTYPKFGNLKIDSYFIAVLSIFVLTVILDSESDTSSNRTYRRGIAYEFVLRWLSEWNYR